MSIRLHRIRGCFAFVRLDSRGDGLPIIYNRRAWRPSTYKSVL